MTLNHPGALSYLDRNSIILKWTKRHILGVRQENIHEVHLIEIIGQEDAHQQVLKGYVIIRHSPFKV